MKKTGLLLLALILMVGLFAACSNDEPATQEPANESPAPNDEPSAPAVNGDFEDGLYYAEADDFSEKSGWKGVVALKVENGVIVEANWTALHRNGGTDKKLNSIQGDYGMVAFGDAVAEWHEQAAEMEQLLIETQDPNAINLTDDGKVDGVSSVTITVTEFVNLANKALAAGPVEAGPYKDGNYQAEGDFNPNSGWKDIVDVTVLNGHIFAVAWNGVHQDGGDSKRTVSLNGDYGMVANGGATAEWHEQALAAEQFLLENQDPTAFAHSAEGYTDAVSSVTIRVGGFVNLVTQALEEAK